MRIYVKPDVQLIQITSENNIATVALTQWLEGNDLNTTEGITTFQFVS